MGGSYGSASDNLCEGRRAHLASLLELQEEAVAARTRVVDHERDWSLPARLALGVGVQEGLVVFAQGNEMPVGSQVGIYPWKQLAALADSELDFRRSTRARGGARNPDLVAVAGVSARFLRG